MNINDMSIIVKSIKYKANWFIMFWQDSIGPFVQLRVENSLCSITGKVTDWKSSKIYLTEFMSRQEIVGSVFGLIERAELHEMREFFRYKGRAIYNPHIDPDVLVEIASKAENFNCRENSMSMVEK
jgi:hypothetical protein